MWDGYEYASAINRAAVDGLQLADLRLAGHASHAYAALAIAAQALAPGRTWPILVLNALLWLVSVAGLWRLSAIVFPQPELRMERSLVTAAFAAQPALLAAVVQPGLDLAVVPWFLWTAVFLRRGRWTSAALTGMALTFTKETGGLLYTVLVAATIIGRPRVALGSPGARPQAGRRVAILALPCLTFAAYLLYRANVTSNGEALVWNAGTAMIGQSLVRQLLVPRLDRYVATSLALMFVLNFAWIPTLGAVAGFAAAVRAVGAAPAPWRSIAQAFASETGFTALALAGATFALTRFATFGNSRYLVTLMALVLFPFLAALIRLRISARFRGLVLGTFCGALVVSNVRTVDPVSRWLYGTFPVGSNEMLHMTRITHECCGLGRDQLVYSLEFTSLDALTQRALATLPELELATIVVPDSTNWFTIGPLDPRTLRRTLRRTGAITPRVMEPRDVLAATTPPARLYYLALPYAGAARGLSELRTLYDPGTEQRYERAGYTLPVYALTLRGRPPRDSAAVASARSREDGTR